MHLQYHTPYPLCILSNSTFFVQQHCRVCTVHTVLPLSKIIVLFGKDDLTGQQTVVVYCVYVCVCVGGMGSVWTAACIYIPLLHGLAITLPIPSTPLTSCIATYIATVIQLHIRTLS